MLKQGSLIMKYINCNRGSVVTGLVLFQPVFSPFSLNSFKSLLSYAVKANRHTIVLIIIEYY